MKISVVIPSYKSEESIEMTIKSILDQSFSDFEIIVVDSSPTNEVDKIILRYPDIKFIKLEKRTRSGIARNVGVKIAQGELLAFFDADIILEGTMLKKAWDFYQQEHFVFSAALELYFKQRGLTAKLEHYLFFNMYQKNRNISERSYLPSGALFVDLKLFNDAKGFNNSIRGEDTAFTNKLYRQGEKVWFNSELIAYRNQSMDSVFEIAKKSNFSGKSFYDLNIGNKSILIKIPLFFLIPIFILLKTMRILFRNARFQKFPDNLLNFVFLPFLLFLNIFWGIGIYESIFHERKGL